MARTRRKSDALRELIAAIVSDCGLLKVASYVEITGVKHDTFALSVEGGEVVFNYGCAHSNSGALFVSAQVGLNSVELSKLLDSLVPELSKNLACKYALLGWGISDTAAVGFDPSPERPGSEFVVSDPISDMELAFLKRSIPLWIQQARRYLDQLPVYEFYRYDSWIDRSGGWREMAAILKIIGGERYVGYQLLYDLGMEAKGLRAPMGSDWWAKHYGLKRNDERVEFIDHLMAAVSNADGNGIFGRHSLLEAFRARTAKV